MRMIASFADGWGVTQVPDGKSVWFWLALQHTLPR